MNAEVLDLTEGYWRAIDLAEDWWECRRCGDEVLDGYGGICAECRAQ